MTLRPEYEDRLRAAMKQIESGSDAPNMAEITETFKNITNKLDAVTALLAGEEAEGEDKYFKYFPTTESNPDPADDIVSTLERDIESCWGMVEVFMRNRDARGIHDMGVEIQALERTLREIKKLRGIK